MKNLVGILASVLFFLLTGCVESTTQLRPAEVSALQSAHNGGCSLYSDCRNGHRGYQNQAEVNNYGTTIEYRAWSYGGDPQPAEDLRRDYRRFDYHNQNNRDWERYPRGYEQAVDKRHPRNCQYTYVNYRNEWVCR